MAASIIANGKWYIVYGTGPDVLAWLAANEEVISALHQFALNPLVANSAVLLCRMK